MNCMKCGREVKDGRVFCDLCMESMEEEPIKINTPVLIPAQPPKKSSSYRRPVINPAEEIKRLEKQNQNLILFLMLTSITLLLLIAAVFHQEVWDVVKDLGRNYSVLETTAGP